MSAIQRASFPAADTQQLVEHLESSADLSRVRQLKPSYSAAEAGTVAAILSEAARFAETVLAPLNVAMDSDGASLVNGRVTAVAGHKEAWAAYIEAGWPGLDHSEEYGGQDLPLALGLAVQEVFDRSCPAFGMLPVPQRGAAKLIFAFGDEGTKAKWLPGLASGRVGATICISEAGAGSDVRQLSSRASPGDDGAWYVSGEKCWISFGDHDLTDEIIHCVLARTDSGGQAAPEISLFLVEGGSQNQVQTRRIEEKLGLHGSPTCALGFEGARATLLGERGRGLAQMFVMITQMRLAVGAMGLGIASGCTDAALSYAEERRQGGNPGNPLPIAEHPDIQRLLLEMTARSELLRGLILNTANAAEIASHADSSEARAESAFVQWLLPIVKTFGADAAFFNASAAIQVLGGAGYTRDWPVEQALRDARVLSVFEGTSGIQALDLVYRRVLKDSVGLDVFIERARSVTGTPGYFKCLDLLEDAAARFKEMDPGTSDVEAGATAFLELAILAATGWVAGRFLMLSPGSAAHRRMQASAAYWHDRIGDRAALQHAEAVRGVEPLRRFVDLRCR